MKIKLTTRGNPAIELEADTTEEALSAYNELSTALKPEQKEPDNAPIDLGEVKICPDCGAEMKLREGKYGKFWGCTNYPACKKNISAK